MKKLLNHSKSRLIAITILLCLMTSMFVSPPLTTYASNEFDDGASKVEGGTFGDGLTWSLDDTNTLTISGTGPMPVFNNINKDQRPPWFNHGAKIEHIIINQGITEIRGNAFDMCTRLVAIELPVSLTKIIGYCFNNSKKLANVYYTGTKEQWNNVTITGRNDYLLTAKMHYNASFLDHIRHIDINGSTNMFVGETQQLLASIVPYNTPNNRLIWSSNNPAVANMLSNGVVTAFRPGIATITAKTLYGSVSDQITITVTNNLGDYSSFAYTFGNYRDSFKYPSDYHIPPERYMQLGYDKGRAIVLSIAREWGGNCYGMSASSILFCKNILQEQNYPQNGVQHTQVSNFIPPGNVESYETNKLTQMIELLHISQYITYQRKFSAESIAKQLDKGHPVKLGLKDGSSGHSVVIYNYTKTGDTYKFDIYDCSDFVTQLVYTNENNYTFIPENTEYIWKPSNYVTYADFKEIYDYINYYNFDNAASLFSTKDDTSTYIIVDADNFIITNSQKQNSFIIDGDVSGDIENIQVIPNSYLAENPSYTIILPTDTYTITGSSDKIINTIIADDYMSASVISKSSTPITISNDLKDIHIGTTEGEEFDITYTTYDNIFDEANLKGIASCEVTSSLKDSEIMLTGTASLTATASVSESTVSASVNELTDYESISVKFENEANNATVQISSTDKELSEKAVLPERLTTATPVYDLVSGEYNEGQTLTFTKDDGTIVYYTTDGSIPSADNGILYTLPIEINQTVTIKAIATKYGYSDSEVLELNYILPEVELPHANINSGEYDTVQLLELKHNDAEIYYTIDDFDNNQIPILYTTPITVYKDMLIKTYAIKNGVTSDTVEYEYTITPKHPFYFSNAFKNQDEEVITLDNISAISKIKLPVSKLLNGEYSGTFIVAFYDKDDKLICIKSKYATVDSDYDEIEIDITNDLSTARTVEAFIWDDFTNMNPICDSSKEEV